MAKILIIKLGYSETLDKRIWTTTSLGDVLRTTVVLNYFKHDKVTWLVDERAYPLLENNSLIERILVFNQESVLQLQSERFDTVINLEKSPGICAFSDSVNAWRKYGFGFNAERGIAQAHNGTEKILSLCFDSGQKKENLKCWQEALASMVEKKWAEKEEYILGYKPRSSVKYDIGFNWVAGNKWPNKMWPRTQWEELESLLKNKHSVTWQRGLNDLYEYIDWINSCRLIVSNDSLGMHLAIVLKKKMVVLFGPSSSREVWLYHRGVKILPKTTYSCVPCFNSQCTQKMHCMEFIKPEEVKHEILKLLSGKEK